MSETQAIRLSAQWLRRQTGYRPNFAPLWQRVGDSDRLTQSSLKWLFCFKAREQSLFFVVFLHDDDAWPRTNSRDDYEFELVE